MNFIWENENDNISCAGQVISVPKGQYSGFMYLGCSEFGSHSEPILVKYTDGQTEEVALELSDWVLSHPLFQETVAWTGKGAKCKKTKAFKRCVLRFIYLPSKEFFAKRGQLKVSNCLSARIFIFSPSRYIDCNCFRNKKGDLTICPWVKLVLDLQVKMLVRVGAPTFEPSGRQLVYLKLMRLICNR